MGGHGASLHLTDAEVKAVATHCPNLTQLDLTSCTMLTLASVTNIAENLRCLTHLQLSDVRNNIDDAAFAAVILQCTAQTNLGIY